MGDKGSATQEVLRVALATSNQAVLLFSILTPIPPHPHVPQHPLVPPAWWRFPQSLS